MQNAVARLLMQLHALRTRVEQVSRRPECASTDAPAPISNQEEKPND